jgi:hypothetical protein
MRYESVQRLIFGWSFSLLVASWQGDEELERKNRIFEFHGMTHAPARTFSMFVNKAMGALTQGRPPSPWVVLIHQATRGRQQLRTGTEGQDTQNKGP